MKMKPITILAILVALTLAFMPAPATTVHVVRYIPAGGTMWGAVESAMAETGDTRPVDEVMFETKQLNPGLSAGLVQPGTRIIVPCQVERNR